MNANNDNENAPMCEGGDKERKMQIDWTAVE